MESGACGGQFRVGPRRFGAGPQLVIDQGVDSSGEHVPALDVRIRRRQRPLSAHDVEECTADRILYPESRQPLGGLSADNVGVCFAHNG